VKIIIIDRLVLHNIYIKHNVFKCLGGIFWCCFRCYFNI